MNEVASCTRHSAQLTAVGNRLQQQLFTAWNMLEQGYLQVLQLLSSVAAEQIMGAYVGMSGIIGRWRRVGKQVAVQLHGCQCALRSPGQFEQPLRVLQGGPH